MCFYFNGCFFLRFFFLHSLKINVQITRLFSYKREENEQNTNRIKCSATTHMLLIEPACAACNRALKSFETVFCCCCCCSWFNWKCLFARVLLSWFFYSFSVFLLTHFLYSSSVNISVDYSIEAIQDNKYFFICREDYKILFMISHIVNDCIFIGCNPFVSNNSWKDFLYLFFFFNGKKFFFQVECFCHLFSNRKACLIGLTLWIIWRY